MNSVPNRRLLLLTSLHTCSPLLRSSLAPPAGVSLCTSGAAAALSRRTESVAPALLNARGLAYLTQTEAERAAGKREKTRRRRRRGGRKGDEHSCPHWVPPAWNTATYGKWGNTHTHLFCCFPSRLVHPWFPLPRYTQSGLCKITRVKDM